MKRARLMSVLATLSLLVVPAMAGGQDDQGAGRRERGPRMTPEQARAVWKVQAQTVASQLGMADAQGLTLAYLDARKGYGRAVTEARQHRAEGEGRGRRRGGAAFGGRFAETRDAEREKLQSALQPHVSDEQLKQAVAILGSFDRGYDGMTHALIGFELGDEKLMEAMIAVNDFVVARGRLATMDRALRRDAMMDMRDDLTARLSVVLDAGQMETLRESMQRGRRRGGDRRRGRDI